MANLIIENSLRNNYYNIKKKTLTITSTVLLAFVVIAAAPSPALAASPHFIGTPTITKNPNFSLTTTFKAAGLGNVVSAAFLTASGGTALLQCVNPGGNNPPPKQVAFGPLQGQITFIPPSNGQITASASIGPPPLPSHHSYAQILIGV
jgi:hypothetical protein